MLVVTDDPLHAIVTGLAFIAWERKCTCYTWNLESSTLMKVVKQKTPYIVNGLISIQEFLISDNSMWTYYCTLVWCSKQFSFYTGGRTGGSGGLQLLIFDMGGQSPPKIKESDLTNSKFLRLRKHEQSLHVTLDQSEESFLLMAVCKTSSSELYRTWVSATATVYLPSSTWPRLFLGV